MSVRGSPPLLQGVSPENSDGAPLYQWIQQGVTCSPLPIIYWVLLWVAAPVFDQVPAVRILETLQTERGYICRGGGPSLWRKIIWVVNKSQDNLVRAKGNCSE